MTTWRHTEAEAKGIVFPGDVPGGCIRCLWDDAPSPCKSPTPDPASPCGFEDPWAKYGHPFPPCGRPEVHTHHTFTGWRAETPDGGHFYRPTRCTCGHPIEATR